MAVAPSITVPSRNLKVASLDVMESPKSSVVMLKTPSVLSGLSLQSPTYQSLTAENSSAVMMDSQRGFLSNRAYHRVPQRMNTVDSSSQVKRGKLQASAPTLSFPSPIFPLRNRTNLPAGSSNFLLQTIIRDSQQIKAEYQQYKSEVQAKLSQQEKTIRNLKQSVENYKKKVLEMKLQKEVYVARESHAFQEIQKDIQNLLQKVSLFGQAEGLKMDTLLSSSGTSSRNSKKKDDAKCNLSYNDLLENLRELQDKILHFENKSQDAVSSCKVAEQNLKSYMATTNDKLDQIMLYFIENNRGSSPSQSQSVTREDVDASLYNASAEDNQDSDTCNQSSTTTVAASPNGPTGQEIKPEMEDGPVYEVPILPVDIKLKPRTNSSSSSSLNNEIVMGRRKRKSTCSNRPMMRKKLCRKRSRRVMSMEEQKNSLDDGNDSDKPPVLSLPCRLAKHSLSRPHSMPILLPEEVSFQFKVEEKVDTQLENRKDDALIGIKQEISSKEEHGKDFSKIGFVCLCGAKFTGAGGLYVHQVKMMENEKFSCRSCGKKFHYFSGLKAHRKSAHKQEFTQEVGCSRCGQVFRSKKDRQGHLDERGQTCWLSGSYQSKDWEAIRHKRNLSSSYSSSSASSSQNAN